MTKEQLQTRLSAIKAAIEGSTPAERKEPIGRLSAESYNIVRRDLHKLYPQLEPALPSSIIIGASYLDLRIGVEQLLGLLNTVD